MTLLKSFLLSARLAATAFALFGSPFANAAPNATQFSFPSIPGIYDGVPAGYGINSDAVNPADLLMAKAVTFFSISTSGPTNTGGFVYDMQIIQSASDVFKARSASAEFEGRYFMFSGKASFGFDVASRTTKDTVMWIIKADKDYGVRERLNDPPDLKLTDAAQARLRNDGYEAFVKQFGTRFISSWSRMAHLEVIFEASNITQDDHQHVDAMIGATFQYLGGAGDASALAK